MAPATPKLAALTIAAEECVAVEAAPELVELKAREMTSPSAVRSRVTHLEAFEAELLGEVVVGEDAPVVDPELGVDVGPGTTNRKMSRVLGCSIVYLLEVEFKQEEEAAYVVNSGLQNRDKPELTSWVNCERGGLRYRTSAVTESETERGAWTKNNQGGFA